MNVTLDPAALEFLQALLAWLPMFGVPAALVTYLSVGLRTSRRVIRADRALGAEAVRKIGHENEAIIGVSLTLGWPAYAVWRLLMVCCRTVAWAVVPPQESWHETEARQVPAFGAQSEQSAKTPDPRPYTT